MESKRKNEARPVDFMLRVEKAQGRSSTEGGTVGIALDAIHTIKEKYPDAQIHVELKL